jgi:sulfur carrier protein
MEILVNGERQQAPDACTIAQLIESLGITGGRLAVEVNRDVVPRAEHAVTELQPGDRVEIVHAIGGG